MPQIITTYRKKQLAFDKVVRIDPQTLDLVRARVIAKELNVEFQGNVYDLYRIEGMWRLNAHDTTIADNHIILKEV